MNRIMEWLSLKKLLVFGLIGFIGFSILAQRKVFYSIYDIHCTLCTNIAQYAVLVFLIGATTLLPAIILLLTKKQSVLESWKKTLSIYLSFCILNIIFMPWYWGDEFFHLEKDIIALVISVVYLIFSFIFIFSQSLIKKPNQNI